VDGWLVWCVSACDCWEPRAGLKRRGAHGGALPHRVCVVAYSSFGGVPVLVKRLFPSLSFSSFLLIPGGIEKKLSLSQVVFPLWACG
jgi:hypothetical protein